MSSVLITVKREELETAIRDLALNHRVILKDLPIDHPLTKAANIVKLAVTILENNRYGILLDILDEQPRPTSLIPDSSGAFLFGSYQDCYGEVDRHCSPLAIGSIRRNDDNLTACLAQVWVFRTENDRKYYSAITHRDSKQAYVFVDTIFQGFTPHEIELLKKSGVEYVQVFNTDHSRHETVMPMTSIDACPIHSLKGSNSGILLSSNLTEYPGSSYNSENKEYIIPQQTEDKSEYSSTYIIMICAVLVIVALFIGIMVGRSNYTKSSTNKEENFGIQL